MTTDTTEYYRCECGADVVVSEELAHRSHCDGEPESWFQGIENAPDDDYAGCRLAYNEHRNGLGDWCPWSGQEGKPSAEPGDPCPAGCPESRAMEDDL